MPLEHLQDYLQLGNFGSNNSSDEDTNDKIIVKEVPLSEVSSSSSSGDSTDTEQSGNNMQGQRLRHDQLLERLEQLKGTMTCLQQQLEQEKELCKKEVDEIASIQNKRNYMFQQNYPLQDDMSIVSYQPSQSTYTVNLNDYDTQLESYQDALLKAQVMKKANLKRQMQINNYRRRLLEVENMCNLELLKVKQNVQFLQPLRQIASEWQKETQSGPSGDGDATLDSVNAKGDGNLAGVSSPKESSKVPTPKRSPRSGGQPKMNYATSSHNNVLSDSDNPELGYLEAVSSSDFTNMSDFDISA